MTQSKSHLRLRALCEGAIFIALAQVLSYLKLFELPQGGSITIEMLPIFLYCARWGFGPGMLASFAYSILQAVLSSTYAWTWQSLIGDYLLAFTVLGLAGLFRKKGAVGCLVGMVLACLLRFFVHYLSGILLWVNYDKFIVFGETFFNRPKLYSFLYNGSFMLPETLMTIAAAALLFFVPQAKKVVFGGTDLATKKPAAETASNAADTSASSEEEHSVTCPCCSAHFTYRGVSGKCPYCNVLHVWGETDTNKKEK